jgi:hypothetical protein
MTADQVIEVGKWILIVAGGVILFARYGDKFFKYLEKKAEESSVGAKAVAELMQADKKVKDDLELLRGELKEQKETVDKLEDHYDKVVLKALELLNLK